MSRALVKVVDKQYRGEEDVKNLIRYIVEKNDCGKAYNNFFGIRNDSPVSAAKDFLAIQDKYNKNPVTIVRHIVISFDENDFVCPGEVVDIADRIADYYKNEYQVLYGIHDKNEEGGEHIHIHMVVGTTNFHTGKILHEGKGELNNFKVYVNNVVMG